VTKGEYNCYAIVVETTPPKITRNSSIMISLHLRDFSWNQRDPLVMNIFRMEASQLPQVRNVGDIVRVHRFTVQQWSGNLQALLPHQKKYASTALISGTVGDTMTPYWISGQTCSPLDEEVVRALRQWNASKTPVTTSNKYTKKLSDLGKEGKQEYCDIIAKVIKINKVTETMYIWDGTDCNLPPANREKLFPNGARIDPDTQNQRHLVTPLKGSIFPVRLPQHNNIKVERGQWVKFRNLNVNPSRVSSGDGLFINIQSNSSLNILPESCAPVQVLVRDFEQRIQKELKEAAAVKRAQQSLSAHDNKQKHSTCIKAIQNFPRRTYKFRTRARVIGHYPKDISDFCYNDGDKWSYRLKLRLKDATGTLHALLEGSAATTFFHGLPPTDLNSSNVSLVSLQRKMSKLLAKESWIDICLQRYQVPVDDAREAAAMNASQQIMELLNNDSGDESDPQVDVQMKSVYQIHDTWLDPDILVDDDKENHASN